MIPAYLISVGSGSKMANPLGSYPAAGVRDKFLQVHLLRIRGGSNTRVRE